MSWFDVLKVQQRLFGEPPLTEEQEAVLDEGLEENPFKASGQRTQNKPKKSRQTKLPMGSNRRKTSVPTSRESSGQTGDDTKLNIQSATRRLQRQGRGHYNKLADEITRLALEARVDSKQQKVILGKIRSRLADENIPRV